MAAGGVAVVAAAGGVSVAVSTRGLLLLVAAASRLPIFGQAFRVTAVFIHGASRDALVFNLYPATTH